MLYFWRQIFKLAKGLWPPIVLGILINLLIDLSQIIIFLLSGFVYIIVFLTSIWFLGMNQFEKDLISNPFNRTFAKLKYK